MKKVFLTAALAVVLAASTAMAAVSASPDSSYGLSKEEIARFEEAGKKVEALVKAGAPQEEIAAAAAEVQKIYEEYRAKGDAERRKFETLGKGGK